MTADRSSKMNEVYEAHRVQMDNDRKHTVKATQDFLEAEKWNILQWLSLLISTRSTIEQQMELLAVKVWESIPQAPEEGDENVATSVGSRLEAVIDCKIFSFKH